MKKLATIRDNESTKCPFSLPIPFACRNVGECINKMAPLSILGDEADEDELEHLAKTNNRVMIMDSQGDRCPYAGKIFKDEIKKVECNYDSNAPGQSSTILNAAPFYSKVYDNIAYDGLFSYPQGYYADNNISRNTYFGIYSLSSNNDKNIKK